MIKVKNPDGLKGIRSRKLKKIIEAMELLLRHYRTRGGVAEVNYDCPLCEAVNNNNCRGCPWKVIVGEMCVDFIVHRLFTMSYLRLKNSSKWNKKRRRELPLWIEYYKKVLEDRKKL